MGLVVLADVANHIEHINHSLTKVYILIFHYDVISIATCSAALWLQTSLEHSRIELVEGNKLTNLLIAGIIYSVVGNLKHTALITLNLLIHKLLGNERVEHLNKQLELVRHKWIIANEVFLIAKAIIRCRQIELIGNGIPVMIIQFAYYLDSCVFLTQHTLLGNKLSISTLQSNTHRETPLNLTIVISCILHLNAIYQL